MIHNSAPAVQSALPDSQHPEFMSMMEGSPEPVLIAAVSDGVILHANPAFLALTGYTREQLAAFSISMLLLLPAGMQLADILKRTPAGGIDNIRLKTGNGLPVHVDVRAHSDSYKGVPVTIMVMHDVTGHLQQGELLRHDRERFRLALEGTAEGLWDWDALTGEFYHSPGLLTMLGYDGVSPLPGFRSFLHLIHPKDRKHVHEARREYMRSSEDRFEVEFRARHKNGNYIDILCRGFGVMDVQGRICRMVATHTDISERKRTEKLLKNNEKRFRTLYDDSPAMFFTLNRTGRIRSVNRFGAQHLGRVVDEMLDRSITDFIHIEDRKLVRDELKKCSETKNKVLRVEFRLIHQYGEPLWVRTAMRPIVYDKQRSILVTCEDISEARILSQQLEYQAMHDSLTGLINRSEFERRLRRVLMHTTETNEHALCYLDLDQFKVINDTCGHLAGDELLRRLGDLLNTVIRKRDTLARLGGDEFAVLLEHCPFYKAREIAENLLDTIKTFRFEWQDKHFTLGASIGLVPVTLESGTLSDILSMADAACYAAKDAGRNRVHIYHLEDSELSQRRSEMHWVAEITNALEQDRFLLAVQPIISLQADSGQEPGRHYEVLIRMQDKGGEIILPGSFLPAAEKYNLSGRLDQWVVDHVFEWLVNDPAELASLHLCSINLSGLSVSNPHFTDYLVEKLASLPELASKICFELTETAAVVNLGHAIKFMNTMKELGCRFSLDDFGTGLSSFSYLKNLPVDYLKIDGSFIRNIVNDPIDQSMVHSINQIGQVMGKETIAEFVENDAICNLLIKIGVNYAQGYGIGRPVLLRDLKK